MGKWKHFSSLGQRPSELFPSIGIRCPCQLTFEILIFFCKITEPNWTKLDMEGHLEEEIQICTSEVDCPLGGATGIN
jgi:hypothetical protein